MASMSVQSTMALTCCIRQGKKSVFVKQYGEDQSSDQILAVVWVANESHLLN